MYAIVKKVAKPPLTSRDTVDPRALISKKRSIAPNLPGGSDPAVDSTVDASPAVLMVSSRIARSRSRHDRRGRR